MIRRIWLYAGKKHRNLLDLDTIQQDDLLYDLLAEIEDNELDALLNFKTAQYWNLLKKYDYFASYRLKKHARQLTHLTAKELKDLIENIKTELAEKNFE